ncbi:hypothetical protein HGA34_04020 [Candidatus Falkowbacteria bacterium]|nr:hypothetical protein [Candidatus Falkowbacteria bacterium]
MDYFNDEQPIEKVGKDELEALAEEEASAAGEGGLTEEEELEKVDTKTITWFLGLSATAMTVPLIVHLQPISGPIINAILILILFIVGIRSALVVALIPSMMALAGGLLPAILAPAVPFIMLSNVIFIITVDWFYNTIVEPQRAYWTGVLVGAGLKFAFLLISVRFVTGLLLKQELAPKVAQIMSWPQFVTAVIGGAIAWAILKWLKRI